MPTDAERARAFARREHLIEGCEIAANFTIRLEREFAAIQAAARAEAFEEAATWLSDEKGEPLMANELRVRSSQGGET